MGAPEEGNNPIPDRQPATSSGSLSQGSQRMEVHRSPTRSLEKPPTRPRAFHFCRASRDNSIGDGEKVRTFWTCCSNCKISPQGFKPQAEKQQSKSCSKSERLDVYSRPRNSNAISIATDSMNTGGSETAVSSADTLDSTCQSFMSAELDQPSTILDVEAIVNLMECAHSENKQFLDNHEENIGFLRAVSASCVAAQKCGQDTLDLPYTKNELTEALVMVMETLPNHSVPSFILSCSMLAVYNLSKMKPPLASELETGVLRLSLHGVFSMETQAGDAHSMALYRSSFDTMDIMLKGLLSEAPTISHLLFMLEHINFWIRSQDPQERFRAIKCSVSLLRHAIQQSNFEKSGELPALGHQVAQFAVCITDSVEEVSYQAREAISYLYQLLLNQMGLSTREAGELWCQESEDKKMLAYLDACRVGELFRNIFTEDQKRAFLQTSLLAMYDPLMRISQAGILLVYSLLGKAAELMQELAEDVEKEIYKQLHKLRILREVPEALQSLFPN
ncbi:maestro heat-like repeat-containing protein family member 7 isoform 1-T1 [Liasis olivaceus]